MAHNPKNDTIVCPTCDGAGVVADYSDDKDDDDYLTGEGWGVLGDDEDPLLLDADTVDSVDDTDEIEEVDTNEEIN